MIVLLGEVGGIDEYAVVNALQKQHISKPVVAWVTGTSASLFDTNVQFGHAGAMANTDKESATAKNSALRQAGAIVPSSFNHYEKVIRDTFKQITSKNPWCIMRV